MNVPIAIHASIWQSVSGFIVTFVVTEKVRGAVSSGHWIATPVTTWWVRPASERSIRQASGSSSGLPNTAPSCTTIVSKHSTTAPRP